MTTNGHGWRTAHLRDDGIYDEIAVEMAVSGFKVRLTDEEQRAVVSRLAADPTMLPVKEIADRARTSCLRVRQIAAELGYEVVGQGGGACSVQIFVPADRPKPSGEFIEAVQDPRMSLGPQGRRSRRSRG